MDMTISVDEELAQFIQGQIASGRFQSSSDLVREALHLMESVERQDTNRREWLRSAWRDGVESGDAGELDFAALKAEAWKRQTASRS